MTLKIRFIIALLACRMTSIKGEICQDITCQENDYLNAYCCIKGCCYNVAWWKNWYFWVFGGVLVVSLALICLRICVKINRQAARPPDTSEEDGASPDGKSPSSCEETEKQLPEKYRRILIEYEFIQPRNATVETRTNTKPAAHEYRSSAQGRHK